MTFSLTIPVWATAGLLVTMTEARRRGRGWVWVTGSGDTGSALTQEAAVKAASKSARADARRSGSQPPAIWVGTADGEHPDPETGTRIYHTDEGWRFMPLSYEGELPFSTHFPSARAAAAAACDWAQAQRAEMDKEQIVDAWHAVERAEGELRRLQGLDRMAPRVLLQALEGTVEAWRSAEQMRTSPWGRALAGELAELGRLDVGTLANRAACLRALVQRHDEALGRAVEEHHQAVQCLAGRLRAAADELEASAPEVGW